MCSHSSSESRGRKGRASMRLSIRTHCSEWASLTVTLPSAFADESFSGGTGAEDADSARIRTSSKRVEASMGWSAEIGEGGDVILTRLLTANLNCLEDRFWGNTYMPSELLIQNLVSVSNSEQLHTYLEQSVNIWIDIMRYKFRVSMNREDYKYEAMCCLKDLH